MDKQKKDMLLKFSRESDIIYPHFFNWQEEEKEEKDEIHLALVSKEISIYELYELLVQTDLMQTDLNSLEK